MGSLSMLLISILFCAIFQQTSAAIGNTYYTSAGLKDDGGSGSCTQASPCYYATAAAKCAAGDTLYMNAGLYLLDPYKPVTTAANTYIKGDAGGVFLQCAASSQGMNLVGGTTVSGNFSISNCYVGIITSGNGNRMYSVKIDGSQVAQSAGIFLSDGNNTFIVNATISGASFGIVPASMESVTQNNFINNCVISGPSSDSSGVYLTTGTKMMGTTVSNFTYVLTVTGTAVTITGSKFSLGTAVLALGSSVIMDSVNSTSPFNIRGNATITNSNFYDGSSSSCVQITSTSANVTLSKVNFSNCQNSNNGGGAILSMEYGSISVDTCTFTNCSSTGYDDGGAIKLYTNPGSVTVNNSMFTDNSAPNGYGGAISLATGDKTYATVSIVNSIFTGNSAINGGAISVTANPYEAGLKDQLVVASNLQLTGNSAKIKGGAIYSKNAVVSVSVSTLSGNNANAGGAYAQEAVPTGSDYIANFLASGLIITSNSATGFGGAMWVQGNATLTGCNVSQNVDSQFYATVFAQTTRTNAGLFAASVTYGSYLDGILVQSLANAVTLQYATIYDLSFPPVNSVVMTGVTLTNDLPYISFCCGSTDLLSTVNNSVCNYPPLNICGNLQCDQTICSGHGQCNGTCSCAANYYGPQCETFCDTATTCHDSGYCNPDGECECDKVGQDPAANCGSCLPGYSGWPLCKPYGGATITTSTSTGTGQAVGVVAIGYAAATTLSSGSSTGSKNSSTNAGSTLTSSTTGSTGGGVNVVATAGTATASASSSTGTQAPNTPAPTPQPGSTVVSASVTTTFSGNQADFNLTGYTNGVATQFNLTNVTSGFTSASNKRAASFGVQINGSVILPANTDAKTVATYTNGDNFAAAVQSSLKSNPVFASVTSGFQIVGVKAAVTTTTVPTRAPTAAPTSAPTTSTSKDNSATTVGFSAILMIIALTMMV